MTFSFRAAVLAAAICITAPALAQDEDPLPKPPNDICGPDLDTWMFSVSKIGPVLAGEWTGKAPGLGMTTGLQTFSVTISYERGRLYMSGDGGKVELKPVRGSRKPLRYDFIRQQPLPESAHAVKVPLDDFGLIHECELSVAPQFTWAIGSGARRASGVYTFVANNAAIGTMANSGRGAREVYLSR